MYPENPEETQVIVGFMDMGNEIYPTLLGIELTICSIPSARRFQKATVTDSDVSLSDG